MTHQERLHERMQRETDPKLLAKMLQMVEKEKFKQQGRENHFKK